MSHERRRVTIPDVAREAGVSPATVGRALGGYGYVRDEIRERIRQTAEDLGYRPNGLARSMITGRTNSIGVVCADIANPFFASATRGISDMARKEGFGIILTNSDEDIELEREAVRLLLEKQVDGIIASPANSADSAHLRRRHERRDADRASGSQHPGAQGGCRPDGQRRGGANRRRTSAGPGPSPDRDHRRTAHQQATWNGANGSASASSPTRSS